MTHTFEEKKPRAINAKKGGERKGRMF